ncbi:AraC family transcriptional regulator [Zavarzinia aquatilis]|nr:AraC family transcriptional regulator [Zavarzinia aquatilis]
MAPLIRAAALQGFAPLMLALGGDPEAMLRRHAIEPDRLADPEALISLDATALLLEESAGQTRCPDFGLRLAARQNTGMLGLLATVILNAPTPAQAALDASRYLFLHSPAYEIVLEPESPLFEDCFSLRFDIRLPAFVQQRQIIDGCLSLTHHFCRSFGLDQFRLRGVSLPHTPLAPIRTYERHFGAPVAIAQPHAALHAHRDLLNVGMKDINPLLRQAALSHIAAHFPDRGQSLTDRVRQTLKRTVGAGRGTKAEIAALLGLHPRTLQRRLDDEAASFEQLREQVYRAAALRFLCETDLPLKQVAGALGFSEQSALSRSCRRWFDASPAEIRRRAPPAGT